MARMTGLTSRRSLLRGVGAGVFLGGSAAVLPLFGTSGAEQDPADCAARDVSAEQRQLVVSNWPGYLDPRRSKTSTLAAFQRETGISVRYTDDVSDNAEFYAKVKNQLGACEGVGRDIMVLTDWMAARMISLGWCQPFEADRVANLRSNLIEPLRDRQWDTDLTYHAPWQSGLTGIAYNARLTSEVGSFKDLVTRPDLKGRITLLSEMRDTMAFMLRLVDADPDEFTDDQWGQAVEELRKVLAAGQVRAFTGNEYIQDLSAGNIAACEAWSGDVIQAQLDDPDIKFVVPEEGLSLWSDNMLIPNGATHQANAERWIDYYYEPEVAARLAAWVNYICPVQGAQQAMEQVDASLVDNPLIFPDEKMLADAFDFMPLDDRQTQAYEGEWSDVTGG